MTSTEPGVLNLDRKVALVTGGAGGFGRAITQILLENGAQVALCDIDEERTQAAASELGAVGFALDVSDFEANHAVVAKVEEHFGGLDIAFLNAGIGGGLRGTAPLDRDGYRQIMGINLDGVVYGTDAVMPAMRKRGGGCIVATASMAGLVAPPGNPFYALTKAAVIGYVRSLGVELSHEGIRMHALCPGFADTPIINRMRDNFEKANFPIIDPRTVAETFIEAVRSPDSGLAWLIQAGVEPAPFKFRGVPAARHPDGTRAGVPTSVNPDAQAPQSGGNE